MGLAGLAGAFALVVTATPATATWSSGPSSASASYTTGTLVAPTSPAAVHSCVLVAHRVTVSWTASTSPSVGGYSVQRRIGAAAFVTVGSVGSGSTSYQDNAVVGSTTYTYRVRATYQAWTADSTTVNVTTPLLCL